MVIQGRQCTGANTTPLGALNPLFTGERRAERPEGASLLLPHLANQPPNPNAPSWTPPVQQVKKEPSPGRKEAAVTGSWEPSRMRKAKSRSRSREKSSRRRRSRSRERSSRKSRRSRSRSRSPRRRSRSRGRRSRSKGRSSEGKEGKSESEETTTSKPKEAGKRKKKSRWGAKDDLEFIPGMPVTLPPNLTEEQQRLYLIHVKIEEINKKLRTGDLEKEETRSPSPEPIYNSEGKRLNTREFRVRKKLEDERQALIQEAMRLNPNFKPACGDLTSTRHQEKVMIPVQQNPNVNFMGLLIGPRGNSLKKLEEDTGTKIMIRGKGSVKEGKGRKDGQPMPGEDEDLHALISAPTEEGLHGAIKKITSIINDAICAPDNTNELKKTQMRELALLNGTLRDEELLKCRNCGASDHRDWECQAEKNVTQAVVCNRCGGGGHLASDCTVDLSATGASSTSGLGGLPDKAKMDSEYMSLMAELGVAEDGMEPGAMPPKRDGTGPTKLTGFAPRPTNMAGSAAPRPPIRPLMGEGFNRPRDGQGGPPRGGGPGGPGGPRPPNRFAPSGPRPSSGGPGGPSGRVPPPWENQGNSSRGGGPSRPSFRGGAPPPQRWNNSSPGRGQPRGGGFGGGGGFRGPAPWEQPSYGGGYDGGFDGGYGGGYGDGFDSRGGYPPRRGGFGGPPVSIPSTKPPPPPEEPPADQPSSHSSNPWDAPGGGMGGGAWPGMMPHASMMPPWMTGPMGVQIPSVPPAPPSQPPPPN